MASTIGTTYSWSLHTLSAIQSRPRCHVHALSDEIVRSALACLDAHDLQQAAQVCVRWRRLASALQAKGGPILRCYMLPWDVLRHMFDALDAVSLEYVTRVSVQWRAVALSFFSTRIHRRHAHDLPAEVIKRAFAFLDFDNLRYAAQVCVRWRDLGIEHPGFWQDIEASSATAGALDLLAARLGQSGGRPFSLSIDIPSMHPLIETKLMDLISAIMRSVRTLRIRLDAMYLVPLWAVLDHPAPQLVTFHVKLYSPDRLLARIPLNPWIFGEKTGVLEHVHLEDVLIANVPGSYPSFAGLRTLQVIQPSGSHYEFPGYFLELCPHLELLTLFGGRLTFNRTISKTALERLARLHTLDVHLDPQARVEFVQSMPLESVPVVVITTPPDEDAAYDFLAAVRAPFNVGFARGRDDPDQFYIMVESLRTHFLRVFAEYLATYLPDPAENDMANFLFSNNLFPEQVEAIKISLSLWDLLVPYLADYSVVRTLVLDVDSVPSYFESLISLPRARLRFPNLTTLILEARETEYAAFSPEDILHFIDDVVQAPQCSTLQIHRVLLKTPVEAVRRRFETIIYSTTASFGLYRTS